MIGLNSTKPRGDTKDYFRTFVNNRPKNEPNFIWPIDQTMRYKRQSTNEESTTDSYLSSFKSIYADEILIKPKLIKTDNQPRENTFDTIFGNSVRGYSVNNTTTEADSHEVFSRTTTLKNEPDIRSKDKLRKEQMMQIKAPAPIRQDLVDLLISKAQAIDSTFMENVESDTNSLVNGSASESMSTGRMDQNQRSLWVPKPF
ncbi:hypothetical protein HELRODRAFT_177216 [Helobdella robusta]|uniref:Uncharacterized protein n=1 Tax=Helobdella robusta TaxID=6412 RepID=T1FBD3_HELRO|nr:hypothetical protein HELRODRAFT_177216 [Helobdella robusta]ESN98330.1 hypothetical protein HELRODRAFT_177216 [Helobdella robusta]